MLIAKEIKKLYNIENIYVVNGYRGEADAMSILSKACNEKTPILITNPDSTKSITGKEGTEAKAGSTVVLEYTL